MGPPLQPPLRIHGRTAGPQLPSKHFLSFLPIPVGIPVPWIEIQETLVQDKYGEDTQGPETQALEGPFPGASHPQGGYCVGEGSTGPASLADSRTDREWEWGNLGPWGYSVYPDK